MWEFIQSQYEKDTAHVNALNVLSNDSAPLDKALSLTYADSALTLAQELNYTSGAGYAIMYKGLAYDYAGEFETALKYYDSAVVIQQISGNRLGLGKAINNIGIVHQYTGNYDEACKFLLKSIPIFKEVN